MQNNDSIVLFHMDLNLYEKYEMRRGKLSLSLFLYETVIESNLEMKYDLYHIVQKCFFNLFPRSYDQI